MVDDNEHGACVAAWLSLAAKEIAVEQLEAAFEAAFTALWRRAHQTLGDVTLTAIVDRVFYVAAEQHPLSSALDVDETGVRWDAFRQRAAAVPVEELVACVRFVLVELLTVLGKLTGEVLTPPLHAELQAVASATLAGHSSPPDLASSSTVNGEDAKP